MGKYKYYKQEKANPFSKEGEYGKATWWDIERMAFDKKDEKQENRLSMKMCEYLKNRVWEDEPCHDTTLEVMYKRAHELYVKGIWSAAYLCFNRYTIEEAERMNNKP